MDTPSSFSKHIATDEPAEQIYRRGSTCDTFIVRRFGKLLFKKKLKPEYKNDTQYILAFRKEFEVGYSLDHPALPRYISLDEDDGCPYILEEYIEGVTLADFTAEHPDYFHNRRNAKAFIDELLSVMAYLHDHQILFLDLKPDNVMITSIGNHLRLVDLGGCLTDGFRDTESYSKDFAAPEQTGLQTPNSEPKVSISTDIYLIGKLLQHAKIPAIYNKVVAHCLKANPDERYQSVGELQRAVSVARRKHKSIRIALSAILLLLCVSSTALLLSPNENRDSTNHLPIPTETTNSVTQQKASNRSVENETQQKEEEEKKNQPATTAKERKNRKTTSDAEAMTAELHKAMDAAYRHHLSAFDGDTLIAAKDFYAQSDKYSDEVNVAKKRLANKYPTVGHSEIEAQYMEYYNRKVLPLWDKVDKKAWH